MWGVPSDQAEKLAAMKRFTVVNAPTMRVGYLVMDAAGRTGKDNPFTKLEVRQARITSYNVCYTKLLRYPH